MKSKLCTKCMCEFPSTNEYFYKAKSMKCGLHSWCKKCFNKQVRIYKQSDRGREGHNLSCKKYRQSEKGKKQSKEYQQTEKYKSYYKSWQQSEKGKEIQKKNTQKYLHTEKGKKWINRINNKRRKLGYIELLSNPFNESEKVEWHHIGLGAYVVAIPKDLHQLYMGKYHKEKCMEIVKQIYIYEIKKS